MRMTFAYQVNTKITEAGEMLVNLETTLQERLDTEAERRWKAVAAGFLLNNDREVAVGKITEVLKRYLHEASSSDRLIGDHKPKRVDFHAIALELIHAAEAVDPTIGKRSIEKLKAAA